MNKFSGLGVIIAASMTAGLGLASDQPSPTIHIFYCGTLAAADISALSDTGEFDGRTWTFAVPCYLVSHPDGMLFWDAGFAEARATSPDNGTDGFRARLDKPLAVQLDESGIVAADIDMIALSHLHWDHAGNANAFAGTATWLAREAQIDYGFRESAAEMGFDPKTYGALEDGPTQIIAGDHDVFGDGSVILLSAPGHTPGHQVLFVDLKEYGPIVLSGDLYPLKESREKRLVPSFNFDKDMTLASMERIEAFIAERGAKLIVQHSVEDYEALPHAPDVLK